MIQIIDNVVFISLHRGLNIRIERNTISKPEVLKNRPHDVIGGLSRKWVVRPGVVSVETKEEGWFCKSCKREVVHLDR